MERDRERYRERERLERDETLRGGFEKGTGEPDQDRTAQAETTGKGAPEDGREIRREGRMCVRGSRPIDPFQGGDRQGDAGPYPSPDKAGEGWGP